MGMIGNAPYAGVIDTGNILDGAITSAKIKAAADLIAKLGYTPVNKAGDSMNGALNMQGNAIQLAGVDRLQYKTLPYNGGGYESQTEQGYVQTNSIVYGADFEIAVNIGTGGVDTKYWYVQFPTGMYFVGSAIVEVLAGGWNYGQVSAYARWHVRMINGTVTVVSIEDSNSGLSCTAKAFNHNSGSNMYHRIALYNAGGRNTFWTRIRFSHRLADWGAPNSAITNTNPTA
jgi:hypothetical protein